MVEVGDTLNFELIKQSESGQPEKYHSKVLDLLQHDIVIEYPISVETGKQSFFWDGTQFLASYVGQDTAVYQFETEIIGRKKQEIPVLIIKGPIDFERIQRREYVRVSANMDLSLSINGKNIHSSSIDLSGGGCSFLISQQVKVTDDQEFMLSLSLKLPNGTRTIRTKSRVVRSNTVRGNKQMISCEFLDIPVREREHIIQFCYKKQLLEKTEK
ncbi:putative transferase [Bacillus sp. TS-2]|nr:putative transferase [Bacillus sp. TS-2]